MWLRKRGRRIRPVRRVLIGMLPIGAINVVLRDELARRGIHVTALSWYDHPFLPSFASDSGKDTGKTRWKQRLHAYKSVLAPQSLDSVGFDHVTPAERVVLGALNLLRSLFVYDTFIFVFGASLAPRNRDLPLLRLLGKRVIMIFNGCDIRARDAILPLGRRFSFCTDCTLRCVAKEKQARASAASRYADLILAMPEYAQYLTRYEFLWLPIDRSLWRPTQTHNDRIRIVHAPSMPELKGTKYIERAVRALQAEGLEFDYISLSGRPQDEVHAEMARADVVVDQLMYGWYGLLAIEAMALGKCVLAYISDDCRRTHQPNDVPVLSTSPANILENLRRAILNAGLREELGRAGQQFAEKYHDAGHVVGDLLDSMNRLPRRRIPFRA